MPYTYIIYLEKLKKYYVGAFTDKQRCLKEHNIGYSKFTSNGVQWLLNYIETLDILQEAKKGKVILRK